MSRADISLTDKAVKSLQLCFKYIFGLLKKHLYYLSKFNMHSREITDFPCMLLCYISLLSHAATFFFSLSICFPSTVSAAESKMVRAALVTATSLALTGAVVAHAYLLKHQFYPTVVYLTKSSPSMAVRTVPK